MDNIGLTAEIMTEIFKTRLKELIELDKRGMATQEDYNELYTDAILLGGKRQEELFEKFNEVAETCIKYGNRIIDMQKEMSRERRIVNLFLRNHDLEWKYDNFEARILERILVKQEASNGK